MSSTAFAYRTVAFSGDHAKLPFEFTSSPHEPRVRRHALAVLESELGARGYRLTEGAADLEIVVATGHRPDRFRSGGGVEYDTALASDEELVVAVWDPRRREIVWEGTIDGVLDASGHLDLARLHADVRALMQRFPATTSSQAPSARASGTASNDRSREPS